MAGDINANIRITTRTCPAATPSEEDLQFIAQLHARTETSYEELLRKIRRVVLALSARKEARHEAEDVIQNVALKVFLGLAGFRGECSFSSWIYRIASNELHDAGRRLLRHRLPAPEEGSASREWTERTVAPGPSPFAWAADQEWRVRTRTALNRVNPLCREALLLRVWDELTYEEIAERLDLSVVTVKSRIFTGRQRLRVELSSCRRPAN